jgi:hypothetical protein
LIAGTSYGRLDPAWLDLTANDERLPIYPEAHQHHIPQGGGERNPLFLSEKGAGGLSEGPACRGWVFAPAAIFDENMLLTLLAKTEGISRLKGVFRLADEWCAVNRIGRDVTIAPTAYRRDSRLEVFADSLDWSTFESRLSECLVTRGNPP